jgi:catechol 2,3-dioxygenase-like lactoylglutathione lyase family enzyme
VTGTAGSYGARMTRLVGINHVALEVADLDRSLDFYGRIFDLRLRSRSARAAFVDIGDQFLALMEGRDGPPDATRHFGLVVDDKEATRQALIAAGAEVLPGRRLDFLDPDGNRVEIVQYDQIQFTKTDEILDGMDLELGKTDAALAELREKGLVA